MIRTLILLLVSIFFISMAPSPLLQKNIKGEASYYGIEFQGKKTANGEPYNRYMYTAAHRKLPFNTLLRVTNLENNLSITVKITDRGPYNYSRIIDLSEAAARRIGSYKHGVTTVQIDVLDLIHLNPEIESIFLSNDVLDCLGNTDELNGFSIELYKTTDLLHIIYLANELYLHEDVDKVLIVGKGTGQTRMYSMVISDYNTKKDALVAKDYFERKGFMQVVMLPPAN